VMDLGLKGKVAMVAGASKGLGFFRGTRPSRKRERRSRWSRAISAAIATAAQQIENLDAGAALGFTADVRSTEGISRWHQATVRRLGPVDLLVTNSGGPPAGTIAIF